MISLKFLSAQRNSYCSSFSLQGLFGSQPPAHTAYSKTELYPERVSNLTDIVKVFLNLK
jgi:hypothetical protein